jgi:hypothetical protein
MYNTVWHLDLIVQHRYRMEIRVVKIDDSPATYMTVNFAFVFVEHSKMTARYTNLTCF